MELNAKARGPSGSLTIVIFVEVENMPEYDTFMYTASLGTEETKEQGVGLPRKNYDVIDMNLAFPTPPPGETVLHYPGNSIYDSCEPTYYVISKTTIIINPEQLNELMDRQSNYPVNPNKIIVFDDKKPPEDPKPVPPKNDTRPPNPDPYDIRDPYIFDIVIYINIYPVYPYPRYKDPPQIPEKYPYPDFPYPDTWSWTGQPNYPNDPWYPQFVFPPQPIFPKTPEPQWPDWPINKLPKEWPQPFWPRDYTPAGRDPYYVIPEPSPLQPFDVFYLFPLEPDQSPQWPFGYPIWPIPVYPVWPQNADFFPRYSDPYNNSMPKPPLQPNTTNGTTPNSTNPSSPQPDSVRPHPMYWTPLIYPFVIHPLLPIPIYTYIGPFTTYPVFPVERWPDNPFDP